jgi:hypothetical protein
MFDRIRLSRLITLALASCAVTWAFSAGALARPDTATTTTTTSAPVYKAVQGDVDKAPSASTAPAYQPAIGDSLKTPDRAAVDANLANLARGGKTPGVTVASTGDDNTDTIALITAIAAMLVAIGAVTYIVVRPQGPVLRA